MKIQKAMINLRSRDIPLFSRPRGDGQALPSAQELPSAGACFARYVRQVDRPPVLP